MQQGATLGGSGAEAFTPQELSDVQKAIRDSLAPKKSRTWSLIVALLDPNLRVFRYTHRKSGLVEYFCEDEVASLADADDWVQGEEIRPVREPLKVKGPRAEELGLARHTVNDFNEFRQLYNLEDDVALAEPGWAGALIDALAMRAWRCCCCSSASRPCMPNCTARASAWEPSSPAFASCCSSGASISMAPPAGWKCCCSWPGLVCILLEIFVLPGVAIFGLGGGLLIIVSLVLASQTFVLPHNDYQFQQLRDTLLGLAGVAFGVVAAAVLMRRLFPHAPLLNHMVLEPPSIDEIEHLAQRESLVDFAHLLGRQGVTTTPLAPAGKARFDGQSVDVSSHGEFIDRGTQVTVVEVHGNRVIVRPVA